MNDFWVSKKVFKSIIIKVLVGLLFTYVGVSVVGAALILRVPRLPLTISLAASTTEYEEVRFVSRIDNIELHGWLIGNQNKKVVVFIHGGFQNRVDENVDTLGLAGDLVKKGYDILLFDLRGRGESAGKARALSYAERDIGGAIDFLTARQYESDNIALFGFCSGAVSALMFTSQEEIGGLILDGCFPTLEGMVIRQASVRHIPTLLVRFFIPGIQVAIETVYRFDVVDPIDVVAAVDCPILFIHEQLDDTVSWNETERLYKASSAAADEIWQVPGAAHSRGYKTRPVEFVDHVDRFLNRALAE